MKPTITLLIAAALAFGQAPAKPEVPAKPEEIKPLSREALLELDLALAQEQPLRDALERIAAAVLGPYRDRRAAVYAAACKAAGWPPDECQPTADQKGVRRVPKPITKEQSK